MQRIAGWVAAGLAVLALIFAFSGGLAYDRGMYLDTLGVDVNVGGRMKPFGHCVAVKVDRALGPDRTLVIQPDAQSAVQYLRGLSQIGLYQLAEN